MEKQISKFNISSNVTKGNSRRLIICSTCKHEHFIDNINKLTYSKLKQFHCHNCGQIIQIGNIFNFKTGTKLNDRNEHHNQELLDNYIWNDRYDKI